MGGGGGLLVLVFVVAGTNESVLLTVISGSTLREALKRVLRTQDHSNYVFVRFVINLPIIYSAYPHFCWRLCQTGEYNITENLIACVKSLFFLLSGIQMRTLLYNEDAFQVLLTVGSRITSNKI